MRAIVIDPRAKTVEERDIDWSSLDIHDIVGKDYVAGHHVVRNWIPDHDCVVDRDGIKRGKDVWTLRGCRIWGPMVIYGTGAMPIQDATISLATIQSQVKFAPLD